MNKKSRALKPITINHNQMLFPSTKQQIKLATRQSPHKFTNLVTYKLCWKDLTELNGSHHASAK